MASASSISICVVTLMFSCEPGEGAHAVSYPLHQRRVVRGVVQAGGVGPAEQLGALKTCGVWTAHSSLLGGVSTMDPLLSSFLTVSLKRDDRHGGGGLTSAGQPGLCELPR